MDRLWAANPSSAGTSWKLKVTLEHESPAPSLSLGKLCSVTYTPKPPTGLGWAATLPQVKLFSTFSSSPNLFPLLCRCFLPRAHPSQINTQICTTVFAGEPVPRQGLKLFPRWRPQTGTADVQRVFFFLIQTDIYGELLWVRPQRGREVQDFT